jgi:hypothetical protein
MEALADSLQLLGTERAVSEEQLAGICEAWLELGYEKWHDIVGAREEALLCLGVCLRDSAQLLIDAANSGNLCERSDGARVRRGKYASARKAAMRMVLLICLAARRSGDRACMSRFLV